MNHLVRTLLAIGCMLVLAGCSRSEFPTAQGDVVDLDQLRGQWVLVNYWAEWCKPCLEEIPELNELDRHRHVRVLGVNLDDKQGRALREAARSMDIEFTVLATDPGKSLGWQQPLALPATFVLNPEGQLQEARFGPQTEAQLLHLMGLEG